MRPWWNPFRERADEETIDVVMYGEEATGSWRVVRDRVAPWSDPEHDVVGDLRRVFARPGEVVPCRCPTCRRGQAGELSVTLSLDDSSFVRGIERASEALRQLGRAGTGTARFQTEFSERLKLARVKDAVRTEALLTVRRGLAEAHPWIDRCVIRGAHMRSWTWEVQDPGTGRWETLCGGCQKPVASVPGR